MVFPLVNLQKDKNKGNFHFSYSICFFSGYSCEIKFLSAVICRSIERSVVLLSWIQGLFYWVTAEWYYCGSGPPKGLGVESSNIDEGCQGML
jgi:hypothetical protein